jgi:FkbM family methyltransferase
MLASPRLLRTLPLWLVKSLSHLYLKIASRRYNVTVEWSKKYVAIVRGHDAIRLNSSHFRYVPEIMSSFRHYFEAVGWSDNETRRVVDFSSMEAHDVRGYSRHRVFFSSIAEPIGTIQQYSALLYLKPGMIVFDIGAYSGFSSIVFKEHVGGSGTVFAIEPDQTNYDALSLNFRLYKEATGFDIAAVNAAVWHHCNGILFSCEANIGSAAASIVGRNRGPVRKVPSYTLSRLTEIAGVSQVDAIKCDIEGAEKYIFKDRDFFHRHSPAIVVEPHMIGRRSTASDCIKDLAHYGYECREVDQVGSNMPLLVCSRSARDAS